MSVIMKYLSQVCLLAKEITVMNIKEKLNHKDMGFKKGINSPRC